MEGLSILIISFTRQMTQFIVHCLPRLFLSAFPRHLCGERERARIHKLINLPENEIKKTPVIVVQQNSGGSRLH